MGERYILFLSELIFWFAVLTESLLGFSPFFLGFSRSFLVCSSVVPRSGCAQVALKIRSTLVQLLLRSRLSSFTNQLLLSTTNEKQSTNNYKLKKGTNHVPSKTFLKITNHASQLSRHSSQFSAHSSRVTVYCSQFSAYCSQFTVHSLLFTVLSSQFTVYCSQFSTHCSQFTALKSVSIIINHALSVPARHLARREPCF